LLWEVFGNSILEEQLERNRRAASTHVDLFTLSTPISYTVYQLVTGGVSEQRNLSLLSFPPLFFRTDPPFSITHLIPHRPSLRNPHRRFNKAKKECKRLQASLSSLHFTSFTSHFRLQSLSPLTQTSNLSSFKPNYSNSDKNELYHFPSWSRPFLSPISISLLRPPSSLFISSTILLPWTLLIIEAQSSQEGQDATKDRSRMDRTREEHFHSLRTKRTVIFPTSSSLPTSYRGGSLLQRG